MTEEKSKPKEMKEKKSRKIEVKETSKDHQEPAKQEVKVVAIKEDVKVPVQKAQTPISTSVSIDQTSKKSVTKKRSKKGTNVILARGKRKESIARASVKKGKGIIRINHRTLESYCNNKFVRAIVVEPLRILGDKSIELNVDVLVTGGGTMGQAQASRTAIANALVDYFEDDTLRQKFLSIDRSLLIEDVRRVESKKYKGPKARARYQKSYR